MLNFHHLRYFREVAHEGNLTRAAEMLNISQSALSSQIKTLELRLGHDLFERVGRRLELTEEGRIALDHADRIFETGDELLATLKRSGQATPPLRIGALSTLSRNFQMQFLAPVVGQTAVEITLRSGPAPQLLEALRDLALDVVLSTEPPAGADIIAHRLAEQPVALHGRPELLQHDDLTGLLSHAPFILPTETTIRAGFFALADRLGATPRIAADVDDMAMVRLLARAGVGIAVAPAVVVADELEAGRLVSAPFELAIVERFFAITLRRRYPHPLLGALIGAGEISGITGAAEAPKLAP